MADIKPKSYVQDVETPIRLSISPSQNGRDVTPLLRRDRDHSNEGRHYGFENADQVVKKNIRWKRIKYNIEILEACKADDTDLGWRIYETIRDTKVGPDGYTYSILLNDAKRRGDDYATERIISDARDDGTLRRSSYIVADLLHVIYKNQRKQEDGAVFTAMLSTYQKFFEVQPLKDLGLLPDQFYQPPSTSLMQPSPPPLGMMIIAFLVQFEGLPALPRLFSRYRTLIEQAHPVILPLAASDYTSNAYLMALGKRLGTLPLCTSVVEHMLRSSQSSVTDPPGNDLVQLAAPTVQTWSILLAAFLRHKQKLAALKVLGMMRKRDLKPNRVTWNTLISGCADMQDANGAVSALRSMENEGFEADQHTMEGIGRIQDRRKLLEALEEADRKEEIEAAEAEADSILGLEDE
ncbi:MAG: hypothetical protein M1830_007732 [Pleopsidium flavum]|nr:MAG: hypothetical protein M1830_007732 [Pleopsidium flavum]